MTRFFFYYIGRPASETNRYKEFISSVVVNMGKYLPKKGKVRGNNECRKARGIFADLSLFRQIFPLISCFPVRISRNIGENIFRFYTGTTSENTDFHVLVA